jgi:hypothetical protein
MADDDVVVLGAGLETRQRVTASGSVKTRYSIAISSEQLVVNMSAKALGKAPAMAIAELLRERISDIAETAAPNTIRARKTAAKALAAGKSWAVARYSGGRIGETAPNTSDRLFNDSGRLVQSITANASDDTWRVNVAGNRLSGATLDGRGGRGGDETVAEIWERLKSLVPELADTGALGDSIPVQSAIRSSVDAMTTKVSSEAADLQVELVKASLELLEQAVELAG